MIRTKIKKIILSGPLIYIVFLIIIAISKKSCNTEIVQKAFYSIFLSMSSIAYMVSAFIRKSLLKHFSGKTILKDNILLFKKEYLIVFIANFLAMILYFILSPVCFLINLR